MTTIFLGTGLLEHNRWTTRESSIRISPWLTRIQDAGFGGIELWANHALQADAAECERLGAYNGQIIFNHYEACLRSGASERKDIQSMMQRLNCVGMKWNGAKYRDQNLQLLRAECVEVAEQWLAQQELNFRSCCECHGGSVFEDREQFLQDTADWAHPPEVIVHLPGNVAEQDDKNIQLIKKWGKRIGHIHMQMNDPNGAKGARACLRSREDFVRRQIEAVMDAGFDGTWTIEFTGGCARDENAPIEKLFAHAVDDMEFIRSILK
ncbi:MAG: sugar phosphate isomerase/epimerase [Planctomycetes bacterium]|nr:sugar phosphate isomerase/epimerase [Planctomycetota bacterium]